MAYFKDIGMKMNKVIQMLLSSQDLAKLLYYNEYDPLSQPDISNTGSLINTKIFPYLKYPDAETTAGSRLLLYFRDIQSYKKNIGFRELKLFIEVLCHEEVWLVDSNIRPFLIMEEIDKLFNHGEVEELSIRHIEYMTADIKKYSEYFDGFFMVYGLSDTSYIGCK